MKQTIEHIEFRKEEIPVSKLIDMDGRLYSLEIQYNDAHDFYTAILYDDNEIPIIASKLVYLGNAFHACCLNMPQRKLVPLNLNDLFSEQPGKDLRVSEKMFEEKIKIYIL